MKRVLSAAAAACLFATGLRTAPALADVSKLPSDPALPDPLTMFDGQKVATRKQWFEQRRPEFLDFADKRWGKPRTE